MNASPQRLDRIFAALADPTRRGMLQRLARGPATVKELGAPYAMSGPAVTKHLRVLANAGLIARRREGRRHWCRLQTQPMDEASGWIEEQRRAWHAMLDTLADYLEAVQRTKEHADEPDQDGHDRSPGN